MRQQHTFHRFDRSAATGGSRERPEGGASSSMMMPLPPGWICLRDCNLSGHLNQPVVVPYVLIHPDIGVALIEVAPDANPEADSILRRRLEGARFESIFPGFLPILHLALDRADLPSIETILRDAFAALPPLSVPGGDGWTSVVRRALMPRDPSRAAAHTGLPAESTERPLRHIGPAREAETESDMLHREVTAHTAARPSFEDEAPDPAVRPSHPLPWVIMSGVGGLIAVLAVFGLLNRGVDTRDNAAQEASVASPTSPPAAAPPASVVAPVAPPLAAPAPPALPASPVQAPPPPATPPPAPRTAVSSPKPPPVAPPPAVAPPPPAPAPAAPDPSAAAAGASAVPAPAQRPAATATDRLPQVTVRQPANLRTGPDGQANIVRVAPRGESFRVHGRTANGWLHVGDTEPRGWLHTSRLGNVE